MTEQQQSGLKVGEKYLAIDLSGLTLEQLLKAAKEPIAVFPNRAKTDSKHPDFKGRGVAVWVNVKKEAQPRQQAPMSPL